MSCTLFRIRIVALYFSFIICSDKTTWFIAKSENISEWPLRVTLNPKENPGRRSFAEGRGKTLKANFYFSFLSLLLFSCGSITNILSSFMVGITHADSRYSDRHQAAKVSHFFQKRKKYSLLHCVSVDTRLAIQITTTLRAITPQKSEHVCE